MTTLQATVEGTVSAREAPLRRAGPAPANDNFASATVIAPDAWVSGRFVGSTVESTEFLNYASGDPAIAALIRQSAHYTVWYKIIPPQDDTAHIEFVADTDAVGPTSGCLIYQGPVSGTPNAGTVRLLGQALGSELPGGVTALISAQAGVPLWIQCYELTTDQPDDGSLGWGLADFRVRVRFFPVERELEGDVWINNTFVEATLGLPVPMAVQIHAAARVRAEDSINSSYASVLAKARAGGYLQLNANGHVQAYLGDPPGSGFIGAGDLASAPGITVVERAGPSSQDGTLPIDQYVNLLGADAHSAGPEGFADTPMVTRSVERWLQFRVQPPFNSFAGLRVWNETPLRAGWTLKFGVTSDYVTPSAAASSVATTPMPTTDPGVGTPNILLTPLVNGDHDESTVWLVLQMVTTPSAAGTQPIGYLTESWDAAPLRLRFAWTET